MNHIDNKSEVDMENRKLTSDSQPQTSDSPHGQSLLKHFAQRLEQAIGAETLRSFGRRTGISDSALHHYLHRGSEPTLTRLISMADAADVNLLWLATGEGPMRGAADTVNEHPPSYTTTALDLILLAQAIEIVEAEAPRRSAAWKARMVAAIYDLGDIPMEKRVSVIRAAASEP